MGVMRKAESRVGRTFSGIFGRSFKAHVQPAELAAKMVKEMEDRKTVSLSRTYVPNRLTIYLCPEDRAQFSGYEHGLAEELEGHALQFVLTKSYQLAAPPEVSFETDRDLRLGQFGVRAEMGEAQAGGGLRPAAPALSPQDPVPAVAPAAAGGGDRRPTLRSVGGETQNIPAAMAADIGLARQTMTLRMGSRVQEFAQTRVVLGRGRDADFHLEDPNVSRRHTVVYWEGGRMYVKDLGSTNGTFVNGRPVTAGPVRDGDIITIGGSEIIVKAG
jgi:Protein of unknown function (DUF3662)/FHA domain